MDSAPRPCPRLADLPAPAPGRRGWPWTEETVPVATESPLPRISIVVPCRNGGAYLEESLRSILLQGCPDLEVIVMDGASTDNTRDILEAYSPWIAYWESVPDSGQSHAINKGLAKSTGVYFNWHNADDILLPGSLLETIEGFRQHPDALYICRHRLLLHGEGPPILKSPNAKAGPVDLEAAVITSCPGSQPGGLMRADRVRALGGVDQTFVCCMDEELMLRMRLRGPGYYLENPGFIFRVHPGQKSTVLIKKRIREKFRIIRKIQRGRSKGDPLRKLRASSRIFAARHASNLCLAAGHRRAAQMWHLKARLWMAWEKFRKRKVHYP